MNKPVLVVMAAGMGSRYGGMKQIDPVGPCGQVIVDYSLYDARRAGFETVIFVIKHEIEDAFKAAIGERVSKAMFSSSTGITIAIICWKSPSSGRVAWPCKAVCWQALLPALFTASCMTSTG